MNENNTLVNSLPQSIDKRGQDICTQQSIPLIVDNFCGFNSAIKNKTTLRFLPLKCFSLLSHSWSSLLIRLNISWFPCLPRVPRIIPNDKAVLACDIASLNNLKKYQIK